MGEEGASQTFHYCDKMAGKLTLRRLMGSGFSEVLAGWLWAL